MMTADMRFLSYNIRTSAFREEDHSDALNNWRFRKDALLALVAKQKPDVFGLQEDSAEQAEDFKRYFGDDYEAVYDERFYDPDNTEYNTIFVKKGIAVLKNRHGWISDTPKVKSVLAASICYRHANYALLEAGGKKFGIVNTHLDHNIDPAFKGLEAKMLFDWIEAAHKEAVPLIVFGDLNFTPESPAYAAFAARLFDAATLNGPHEPTHAHWLMHALSIPIDYFWTSEDLRPKLKTFSILRDKYKRSDGSEMEPSDHYPIVMDLDLL